VGVLEAKAGGVPLSAVSEQAGLLPSGCLPISPSLKRAARLRQAILKQAFEGRQVEQNPEDEPAEALMGQKSEIDQAQAVKPRQLRLGL
jgi:type I restriction enzyme S subunit